MKYYHTEWDARDAVVSNAVKYLGVKEGTVQHRNIIDSFNNVKPQPRAYSVKYTDAWCATFVTFVFDNCGIANIIERECGCQEMINKMKKRNLVDFKKQNSSIAKGNIVFYDWKQDGHSDHVGIIASYEGRTMKVIEGNHNDAVGYRTISADDKSVMCIATPAYEVCVETKTNNDGSKYDYENLGWNKDANGWWYAYGHKKGDYHMNKFAMIDKQWYAFDEYGYLVDASELILNDKGAIISIGGKRI